MNKFLEEKEKLLNSIENNTPKHWKEYYKNVPLDCIFDDLVLDVNEIKRLTEENQKLKEQLQQKEDIINKSKEHLELKVIRYSNETDYMLDETDLKEIIQILDNKGRMEK